MVIWQVINDYYLWPKIIEQFPQSWKFRSFDSSYLKIELLDGTQISHHCSQSPKFQCPEIWGQSLNSFSRYGISKLVIFQLSRNTSIILGWRDYVCFFQYLPGLWKKFQQQDGHLWSFDFFRNPGKLWMCVGTKKFSKPNRKRQRPHRRPYQTFFHLFVIAY